LPDGPCQRFRLPVEGADRLLASQDCFKLTFGGAESLVQVSDALLVGLEALALNREPLELCAHCLNLLCAVLLDSCRLTRELIASRRCGIELVLDLFGKLFGLPQHYFRAGDLTVTFLQLSDLRFHRPDHLVQPAGFGCGVVDGDALRVERLRLDAHVLGQRVQRLEPLFSRGRQLMERSERCDLRLDLFDRPGDDGRVVEHLIRRPGDGRLILRQRRGLAAQLLDLPFEGGALIDGAAQIGVGPLQFVVRVGHELTLNPQRFDRRPSLPILACELLHRLPVPLELPPRIGHECGSLLGLPHDVRHLLDLCADHLEAGDPLVEIRDARGDRRQLLGRVNRLVPDVLDRGRNLGKPAAAAVELLEQSVERITLVTSGDDNRIQFVGALLRLGAEGQLFEHVRLQLGSHAPTRVRKPCDGRG
jgi:hypothetical protein